MMGIYYFERVGEIWSPSVVCYFVVSARREVYVTYKIINTSKSGTLSQEEFYNIYDAVALQWSVSIGCLGCQ